MERKPVIRLSEFISERKDEIEEILKILREKQHSGRVFQRLPRYKRRRIMSWNIHILPKHLRKISEKETLPARLKHKKKRKMRRVKIPNTKQLPTHIFHSKRMKMEEYFEKIIAIHSRMKIHRVSLKLQKYGCSLYDSSYYCCFHVKNCCEEIFKNAQFLDVAHTRKEGNLLLFSKDLESSSKLTLIGPATFINLFLNDHQPEKLLWIHPAMKKDFLLEIHKMTKDRDCFEEEYFRFELRGRNSLIILNEILGNKPYSKDWVLATRILKYPECLPNGIIFPLKMNVTLSDQDVKLIEETGQPEDLIICSNSQFTNNNNNNIYDDFDLLIIHQRGMKNVGFGIDVICSRKKSEIGLKLWNSLSKQKNLIVLGMKERNHLNTEIERWNFPQDYQPISGNNFLLNLRVTVQLLNGIPMDGSMILLMSKKSNKTMKYDEKSMKPIGIITTGIYSLLRGCGFGIGFCTKEILNYYPKKMKLEKHSKMTGQVWIWNGNGKHKKNYVYPAIISIY